VGSASILPTAEIHSLLNQTISLIGNLWYARSRTRSAALKNAADRVSLAIESEVDDTCVTQLCTAQAIPQIVALLTPASALPFDLTLTIRTHSLDGGFILTHWRYLSMAHTHIHAHARIQ